MAYVDNLILRKKVAKNLRNMGYISEATYKKELEAADKKIDKFYKDHKDCWE